MHMHWRVFERNSSQLPTRGLKWENKPYTLHVKRSIEFIILMRRYIFKHEMA